LNLEEDITEFVSIDFELHRGFPSPNRPSAICYFLLYWI